MRMILIEDDFSSEMRTCARHEQRSCSLVGVSFQVFHTIHRHLQKYMFPDTGQCEQTCTKTLNLVTRVANKIPTKHATIEFSFAFATRQGASLQRNATRLGKSGNKSTTKKSHAQKESLKA